MKINKPKDVLSITQNKLSEFIFNDIKDIENPKVLDISETTLLSKQVLEDITKIC